MGTLAGLTGSDNYFEDFTVGDAFRHARGKTITPLENVMITNMVMNTAQGHFNEHFMQATPFKAVLSYGGVNFSIVLGLATQDCCENALEEIGLDNIRLTKPVTHGDTLYAYSEVLSVADADRPDAGIVTFRHHGFNQRDELVVQLERTALIKRRSHWADKMTFGALSDIRVIDLTQMLAGPYATLLLADHGATVIKVESPEGDMTRGNLSPDARELPGYFQSIDRNKESVVLDLKSPGGRDAFLALVRTADAVVENFRTGVMERLGLGWDVLHAANPRLVYGCLRGFGDPRTGETPYQQWPAFDVVAQAMGGIMALTGPDAETPTKVGPGVGDIVPGMMLGFGVLAAIHHARRTGEGQFVDVAMTDAVLAICERMVWQRSLDGVVPGPEGNHHPFLCPFGMFPAADGFVTIAAQSDDFFAALCAALEAPALAANPLYASPKLRSVNRLALIDALGAVTRCFTKADLVARLGGKLPFGPVMNIAEIEVDPHFIAREMIVEVDEPGFSPVRVAGVPIKMTATPGGVHTRAPFLGEHTRQRLLEAGLTSDEIETLIAQRAAVARAPSERP